MNTNEFINARDLQIIHNELLRKHWPGSKVMGSNEWEDVDVNTVFDNVARYLDDWHTDVICAACWYMSSDILHKMFELADHSYQDDVDIKVFLIPEDYSIVFFRNKKVMNECVAKLPREIIGDSVFNIIDIIESDNGVEYVYSNKRSFKEFEKGVDEWLTRNSTYKDDIKDWEKQFID